MKTVFPCVFYNPRSLDQDQRKEDAEKKNISALQLSHSKKRIFVGSEKGDLVCLN